MVLRTLDPAWLREQYEDIHRSFADIAADLAIPPSDLARPARKLGLAIRHGVAAHKHILASHGGPPKRSPPPFGPSSPPAEPNNASNVSWRSPDTPTSTTPPNASALERASGTTLLETPPDSPAIRLTPAGEKLAQEVLPILAMLNRTGNGDSTLRFVPA